MMLFRFGIALSATINRFTPLEVLVMAREMKPILFLGAGASAAFRQIGGPIFPTVTHFFEKVVFPDGRMAQGFKSACIRVAELIDVVEGTTNSGQWLNCDAEKIMGCLQYYCRLRISAGIHYQSAFVAPNRSPLISRILMLF